MTTRAGISISAFASTSWDRFSTAWCLCGLKAFGATFFVFADYMRPPIRLAAIMNLPVFYVFTHDSIGVGEDGPTHEPIEQLASLRIIPNLLVIRPCDANEVAEAYKVVMRQKNRPTALILTRQNLPTLDRSKYASAAGLQRGGYIVADAPSGKPEVILIGTGSEVSLCVAAYEKLVAEGIQARVVSLPSWTLFDEQPAEYRDSVLPPNVTRRVGVEMGVKQGWEKYIGTLRQVHRHVRLRHVSPAQCDTETFWLHGGKRGCGGKRSLKKPRRVSSG